VASERVLTELELNRAVLARQLLLERSTASIPRALEQLCGIQNQYAPNGYIRLWTCLEGFEREQLTRALERRSVVQATLFRETIHLVSRRDYPLFAAAIRRSRNEWWRRVYKQPELDVRPAARRIERFLRGTTRTRKELDGLLAGEPRSIEHWVDLVRVPPSGTWEQRRAGLYALASEWVGPLEADEEQAVDHAVRRYLRAFGPASRDDVAKYTGITRPRVSAALARLRLRRFADESGTPLFDVPGAPLPDPGTPAPPRFLPTWDSLLLVHARRTGVLAEEHRARVFDVKVPPSFPTFLVDGRVAGTWKHDGDRIALEPFGRISRTARRELAEEADRLRDLHR
jgi:hypothetical protein